MAATEAYPVAAGEYDKVADKQGFWKVFQEFDKDGSGAVDNDEMKAMVESLGMIVSDKELAAMVKDADEDSSGEIEFPEFVAVIQKAAAAGVAAKGGESFASLISRKANSVDVTWKTDRIGDGITIDGMTASYAGDAHAVVVCEPWMPGDNKYNKGSVIFEVEGAGPEGADVWIGLVGRNFNPEGPHYNQPILSGDKKALATVAASKTGAVSLNGAEQSASKLQPFGTTGAGDRIQLEINMADKEMKMSILKGGDVVRSVDLEGLKTEVKIK